MRVTIKSKNLEITPALRTYIDEKLIALVERLLGSQDSSSLLAIEFSRSTHHRKGKVFHAEVNLSLGKTLLHAETDKEDVHVACDTLRGELETEIKHYKNRKQSLMKRNARVAKKELRFSPEARLYRKGRIRNEGN